MSNDVIPQTLAEREQQLAMLDFDGTLTGRLTAVTARVSRYRAAHGPAPETGHRVLDALRVRADPRTPDLAPTVTTHTVTGRCGPDAGVRGPAPRRPAPDPMGPGPCDAEECEELLGASQDRGTGAGAVRPRPVTVGAVVVEERHSRSWWMSTGGSSAGWVVVLTSIGRPLRYRSPSAPRTSRKGVDGCR
ncbi:hypothetical protein ACFXAF_08675 [Kitasatospora sp. NPDC059463]|uniref:hypothetical protein n=1 Tax=unclassified Kitasatospora TaxID=2633591 RepID=UPI0036B00F71